MLNSQAFLFAAFALTFQASTKKDVAESFLPFYKYVLAGISVTGILAAIWLLDSLRRNDNTKSLRNGGLAERKSSLVGIRP